MASTIKVTNINTPDGTGNITVDRPLSGSGASLTSLPAGNLTGAMASGVTGVGKVLQVVSTTFRGTASGTNRNSGNTGTTGGYSEAGVDWSDLDTSITPSATNSKILVLINAFFSMSSASFGVYRVKRGINGVTPALASSDPYIANPSGIGSNTIAGSKIDETWNMSPNGWTSYNFDFNFLDSPNTTNAVVYRINTNFESDVASPKTHTIYLNRTYYSSNDYGTRYGVSTVTLMEVGA